MTTVESYVIGGTAVYTLDDSGNLTITGLLTAATLAAGATTHTGAITYSGTMSSIIDVSALTSGSSDIVVKDNVADALTIREGSNAYLTVVTTDSSESVDVLKTLRVDTVKGKTGTTGTFLVSLTDNLADALSIKEGSVAYLKFVTTDSSETIQTGVRLNVAGPLSSPCANSQSVADNGTITLPAAGINQLVATSSAANKTGAILTAGRYDGDQVCLINTSANSITFAASGTSHVADGTSAVLAATSSMRLVWSSTASLWFHGN
jgi:hypothetical protein